MSWPSQGEGLQARQEARPSEDHSDPCRPNLCAIGATAHAHCVCGLPMAVGARICDLCRSEGLRPKFRKATGHLEKWDDVSYPSFRLNRPVDFPPARYDALLKAILGPLPDGHPANSTAEEAA